MDAKSIDRTYSLYARYYDLVWNKIFHQSRRQAIHLLQLRGGERVLDVGVGTGLSLPFYPNTCSIIGIDLCAAMLKKGQERLTRCGLSHVELREMDAMQMDFPDDHFDAVVAAYAISTVPDPSRVIDEMIRVCKKGGKLILLNHFKNGHPVIARCEKIVSPLTQKLGFRADLDLDSLFTGKPISMQAKINTKPFNYWDVVVCVNKKGERINGHSSPWTLEQNEISPLNDERRPVALSSRDAF